MEKLHKNFSETTQFKLNTILHRVGTPVVVEIDKKYTQIGIRSHGKGIFIKEPVTGLELGNKRVFWIEPNCFIVNIVFAWERAVAQTTDELNGLIASHRFPMYRLDESKVNLDYFTTLFLTKKGQSLLELASPGGAGRNKTLGQKEFLNLEVSLPNIEVQKYVASFLKLLDYKIQKQTNKVELLKEQRKGYMEKIFKQEIRFKDGDGREYPEWSEYTLSEIGETYSGLSGKTKDDFGFGTHSFITYINVFNNLFAKKDGIEKVNIKEGERQASVQKGDILFTTSSETPLEVGMASIWNYEADNLHLNSFCFGYRITKQGCLPEFIAISLRSEDMRKKIVLLAQGSTRYNISKNQLMKETINIPSLEEQRKIIEFYQNLDRKVQLEQKRLNFLQERKKGFMQQMFI